MWSKRCLILALRSFLSLRMSACACRVLPSGWTALSLVCTWPKFFMYISRTVISYLSPTYSKKYPWLWYVLISRTISWGSPLCHPETSSSSGCCWRWFRMIFIRPIWVCRGGVLCGWLTCLWTIFCVWGFRSVLVFIRLRTAFGPVSGFTQGCRVRCRLTEVATW